MTNLAAIELPEVQKVNQAIRFFEIKDKPGVVFYELSFVGMKDNLHGKVTPDIMARFRDEWNAYCDGKPQGHRKGTPLTELPSITYEREQFYLSRNVHTLDELACLNDGQCLGLGHGVLTDRNAAVKFRSEQLLNAKTEREKTIMDAAAKIGAAPSETQDKEMGEIKSQVAALTETVDKLAQIIMAQAQKPKRGRPPKADPE